MAEDFPSISHGTFVDEQVLFTILKTNFHRPPQLEVMNYFGAGMVGVRTDQVFYFAVEMIKGQDYLTEGIMNGRIPCVPLPVFGGRSPVVSSRRQFVGINPFSLNRKGIALLTSDSHGKATGANCVIDLRSVKPSVGGKYDLSRRQTFGEERFVEVMHHIDDKIVLALGCPTASSLATATQP